jgi:hypothetical protein
MKQYLPVVSLMIESSVQESIAGYIIVIRKLSAFLIKDI